MEKNGQESSWKIFSDPWITSLVIEPTVEVIEIQPKINKIRFCSELVGKATLNQMIIETATAPCSRLDQRTVGSCLKIVPVWERIRIRPAIAEIRLNSSVRRIVCFTKFYLFKHRSRTGRSPFILGNSIGVKSYCLLNLDRQGLPLHRSSTEWRTVTMVAGLCTLISYGWYPEVCSRWK